MPLLRRTNAVGAVVAFARSPTGQHLIRKVTEFATDPRTRATVRQVVARLRAPRPDYHVVDAERSA